MLEKVNKKIASKSLNSYQLIYGCFPFTDMLSVLLKLPDITIFKNE